MQGKIHIGTSGWSYKHWKDLFYPKGVPARKWLSHYAATFDTTEINGSFYRLPTAANMETWMGEVPSSFLFCPKMSRYLTHMKKLNSPEEPLQRFFSIFDPMGAMLGPVLVQLPPQLPFRRETVQPFYELLSHVYRDYRFVIEVRDGSWYSAESLGLMEQHGIGLVISQSNGVFPYLEAVTAPTVYLRFHGPGALYASAYSDKELETYARKMRAWRDEGHSVWAYFNNDIHGYAPVDALRLKGMLR